MFVGLACHEEVACNLVVDVKLQEIFCKFLYLGNIEVHRLIKWWQYCSIIGVHLGGQAWQYFQSFRPRVVHSLQYHAGQKELEPKWLHTHYTHSFVCFYIAASSSCMISFPLAAAAAAAAYSFWKPNINTKSVHVSVLAAVLFGCLEGCLGLHFSSLTLPLFSITQAKSHWVTHKLWLSCGLAVA